MRYMHIRHKKTLIPDGRDPSSLDGCTVDRHVFAENIVVAYHHLGRFPLIPEMLRRSAKRNKRMHLIPLADLRPSIDRHMRQQSGSFSDCDMLTDHAEGPDLHIIGKTC